MSSSTSEILEATVTHVVRYRITTIDDTNPRNGYEAGRIVAEVWSNTLGDRRKVWPLGTISEAEVVERELPLFALWPPL